LDTRNSVSGDEANSMKTIIGTNKHPLALAGDVLGIAA
jgi:hypothetical protein